jgi:hypothetical protein
MRCSNAFREVNTASDACSGFDLKYGAPIWLYLLRRWTLHQLGFCSGSTAMEPVPFHDFRIVRIGGDKFASAMQTKSSAAPKSVQISREGNKGLPRRAASGCESGFRPII